MPGTPGGLSASTPEGAVAVGLWSQGYTSGYPVGFGKLGSTTPKYAVDEAASDGTEAYSVDSGGEATSEGTSGTVDSGTAAEDGSTSDAATGDSAGDASTESTTRGVRVGQSMLERLYHPAHRLSGAWGPRQSVLSHAKRGAFARRASHATTHATSSREHG